MSDEGAPAQKKKYGFAAMDPERQREIARKGGQMNQKSRFKSGDPATAAAGRKGGAASGGNFAKNRERAIEAGRKGGLVSSGRFSADNPRAAECGRMGGRRSPADD